LPIKLGIEELRKQISDQEVIIKMLNEVKDVGARTVLLRLYDVIMALWTYWDVTQDKEAEYYISYYQKKFFNLLFKERRREMRNGGHQTQGKR